MNWFDRCIHAIKLVGPQQTPYGWFHLLFCALTIAGTVGAVILFTRTDERVYRRTLLIAWLVMAGLELYKQIVFAQNVSNGVAHWDYEWYSFPFQFCSSPLYLLPAFLLCRPGKVADSLTAFIGTYVLFGGLIVMLVPTTVFCTDYLGVAVQTMVHHGLMVIIGIGTLAKSLPRLRWRWFFPAIIPFIVLIAVAMLLNEVMYYAIDETFNMFFISPHYQCVFPILGNIQTVVPYPVFLLLYVFGFTLAAGLLFSVALAVKVIKQRHQSGNHADAKAVHD